MGLKIRFIVDTHDEQICFGNINEIEHSETLEKLAKHFSSWEKTLKERAAEHLLREIVGSDQARGYRIRYVQIEEGLPAEG